MPNEFAALAEQLHLLGGPVMRKAQRKALRLVGDLFEAAIVERAPEKPEGAGGLLEPGELKTSFHATVQIASDDAIADGRGSRVVIAPVGHTANLVANWVENGHAPRQPKGLAKRDRRNGPNGFVAPHPFVRPAFDATQEKAVTAYTESIAADIEKAMS